MPAAERTLGQTELDVTGQVPSTAAPQPSPEPRPATSPKCTAAAAGAMAVFLAIPSLPRLINSLLRQLGATVGLVWRRW